MGAGGILTIAESGDYADGALSAGESVEVNFVIGLQQFSRFNFLVDVVCFP